LGLAIAKRFVKTAVKRNQIKRQVRESLRQRLSEIGGFDVVLLVRQGIAKADKREIRETIDHLWRKLKK
jgi:ribonuclease P protein component